MADRFRAKLGIFSKSLTPDGVSSMLGINYDKGYVIGEFRTPLIREKENGWIIRSRPPEDALLEDHIRDVLKRVAPAADMIRGLADNGEAEVEIGCAVEASDTPALHFTRDVVAALCSIGASLDIDLYIWPEEDKETEV